MTLYANNMIKLNRLNYEMLPQLQQVFACDRARMHQNMEPPFIRPDRV